MWLMKAKDCWLSQSPRQVCKSTSDSSSRKHLGNAWMMRSKCSWPLSMYLNQSLEFFSTETILGSVSTQCFQLAVDGSFCTTPGVGNSENDGFWNCMSLEAYGGDFDWVNCNCKVQCLLEWLAPHSQWWRTNRIFSRVLIACLLSSGLWSIWVQTAEGVDVVTAFGCVGCDKFQLDHQRSELKQSNSCFPIFKCSLSVHSQGTCREVCEEVFLRSQCHIVLPKVFLR